VVDVGFGPICSSEIAVIRQRIAYYGVPDGDYYRIHLRDIDLLMKGLTNDILHCLEKRSRARPLPRTASKSNSTYNAFKNDVTGLKYWYSCKGTEDPGVWEIVCGGGGSGKKSPRTSAIDYFSKGVR
jgi:hypothetical protein